MNTSDQRVRAHVVLLFALATLPFLVLPTQRADAQVQGRWTTTGSMSMGRSGHTATLLPNGKVLVAGGCAEPCGTTAELYDPATRTWGRASSMLAIRGVHGAILLNTGKVLVTGGSGAGGGIKAELYDPTLGTWSRTGDPLQSGALHMVPLRNGMVLGTSGGRETQLYDPASGTWRQTGSMNEARVGQAIALLGSGDVLTAGGQSVACCGATASAEVYEAARATWSPIGRMAFERTGHTATSLRSGRVLVVGGITTCCRFPPPEERYDPTTREWQIAGAAFPRNSGHSATALSNGQVLVAGGGFNPTSEASVYDETVNGFVAHTNMSMPRRGHTATLLRAGQVLVAGGNFDETSAEIFTPPGQSPSTTTVRSSDNPSVFGQPVTFTAHIEPAGATGAVVFTFEGPVMVFPEGAALVNGEATSPPHNELAVGRYSVTATYGGDEHLTPSAETRTHRVERAPTRLQATVGPTTSTLGQAVTFRAVVSPAPPSTAPLLAPTGTVTFSVDGIAAGSAQLDPRQPTPVQSRATFTTSGLLPGARAIGATYSGDTSFVPSTSETTSHVVRCGTTLTGSHTVVQVPANQSRAWSRDTSQAPCSSSLGRAS